MKVIDEKDHIGSLSRRSGASRAHRYANISRSESRRIIDAIADHHD